MHMRSLTLRQGKMRLIGLSCSCSPCSSPPTISSRALGRKSHAAKSRPKASLPAARAVYVIKFKASEQRCSD